MKHLLLLAVLGFAPAAAFANAVPIPKPALPTITTPTEPAPAARTIDMTVVLHNFDGKPLKDPSTITPEDPSCSHCADLTLGHAVAFALFANFRDENLAPEQKFARYLLAMRVRDSKDATLTAEEIVVIKRCLGKAFGAVVVGQAYPILDPNSPQPKVE